jgi:hypothetical protein
VLDRKKKVVMQMAGQTDWTSGQKKQRRMWEQRRMLQTWGDMALIRTCSLFMDILLISNKRFGSLSPVLVSITCCFMALMRALKEDPPCMLTSHTHNLFTKASETGPTDISESLREPSGDHRAFGCGSCNLCTSTLNRKGSTVWNQ